MVKNIGMVGDSIAHGYYDEQDLGFFARYENWKKRDLENLYKDATHPNAQGHELMAEELFDYLQNKNLL